MILYKKIDNGVAVEKLETRLYWELIKISMSESNLNIFAEFKFKFQYILN